MRNFRTAAILLAMPLLMTACSKPAEPVADATDNTAATEAMGNAMDATDTGMNATETGMAADVGNSGVPALSSGGPGVITKSSNVETAPAPTPAPKPAPTN